MGILRHKSRALACYRYLSTVYDHIYPVLVGNKQTRDRVLSLVDLDETDRVLDIGCGTGVSTEGLLELTPRVDAIDFSAAQLRRTRRKRTLEQARFVQGDAERLPYTDDGFDAAVAIGVIGYLPEPGALLRETRRVVKPGGRLLVMGPKRPVYPPGAWLLGSMLATFSASRATRLFEEAGWSSIDTQVVGLDYTPVRGLVVIGTNPGDR